MPRSARTAALSWSDFILLYRDAAAVRARHFLRDRDPRNWQIFGRLAVKAGRQKGPARADPHGNRN